MDPDAIRAVGQVAHGGSDDPDVIDFSANTNPVFPDGAADVYMDAWTAAKRYPPEPPEAYLEAAAAYVGCNPSEVIPTPGGLGAIRLAIECTVEADDSVLVPFPSFGEFSREVRLQGATPEFVPHDELLSADPGGHALAIACHPNNPTGDAYDDGAIRSFADRCRDAGTPFLIDEAFLDFTGRPSLAGRDGAVVARSLTKMFGLPGLRAGFAVASDELRPALTVARRPWNLDTPARCVGTYCLRDADFVEATRNRVQSERPRVREGLDDTFDVYPSEAPFLLVDVGKRAVSDVIGVVRERGIAVRDATTFRGLDSHIRVAIRLPPENDRLLDALNHV